MQRGHCFRLKARVEAKNAFSQYPHWIIPVAVALTEIFVSVGAQQDGAGRKRVPNALAASPTSTIASGSLAQLNRRSPDILIVDLSPEAKSAEVNRGRRRRILRRH